MAKINYGVRLSLKVTGSHIYKKTWTPVINEEHSTDTEPENLHNKYMVKVVKNEQEVNHILQELSKYCTNSMLAGATILCKIVSKREKERIAMKYHVFIK